MSGHYDAERHDQDALEVYLARGRSLQARAIGNAVAELVQRLSAMLVGHAPINRSTDCPC